MTKLSILLISMSITLSPLSVSAGSKDFGFGNFNLQPLVQKSKKIVPRPLNDCEPFPTCVPGGAELSAVEEPSFTASDTTKKTNKMYKKRKDSI